MSVFHVCLSLILFKFVGPLLHLMCFLVILLLSKVLLNLSHIEKLSRIFEFKR